MPRTEIQEESNWTTVPDEVFEAGVADRDGRLYWAYASDEDAAYVSGVQGPLEDADRLETMGVQGVEGGETKVPQQFFGKDETDAPNPLGLFDHGGTLEWTVPGDPDLVRVEPA